MQEGRGNRASAPGACAIIGLQTAAAARYSMIQHSRKNTPGFTYESQHQITSYAETITYMKTMIDGTGQTKTDFVRILFGKLTVLIYLLEAA